MDVLPFVAIWSSFFLTECTLLEEGKGEDTTDPATAESRRSPRKGRASPKARAKASARTEKDADKTKVKDSASDAKSTARSKKTKPQPK